MKMASYNNIQRETEDDPTNSSPDTDQRRVIPTICNTSKDKVQCRYVMAVICMLGFMNMYGLRVNLSVAMVAMVNHSALTPKESNYSGECPDNIGNSTQTDGEFVWGEQTQGMILGAFFWGYIITQIPGGCLATRYGGKWLFGVGMAGTGALTLLTAVAANWGSWYLIVVRILEGIFQGVTFPAIYAVIAKWAPPLERTIITTIIYSGSLSGTVISMPLTGLLCQYGFAGGWPSVFYCFGAISLVWFLFYCVLVYDDPDSHPRICPDERLYIKRSLGTNVTKAGSFNAIPWRAIFSSVPVWALVVSYFGYTWGFYTLLTSLPLYMLEVLRYDVNQNGFLSALPYLAGAIVSLSTGFIVDRVVRPRRCIPDSVIRKFCNTTGLLLNAVLLLCVSFVGCDRFAAVTLLTLCTAFGSLVNSGIVVNNMDLAPRFAGVLMGIANTTATLAGMVAPLVVGAITNEQPTRERWQLVFYISAGIITIGALAFQFFGSCDLQPWSGSDWSVIVDQPPGAQAEAGQVSSSVKSDTLAKPIIPDRNAERLITLANSFAEAENA